MSSNTRWLSNEHAVKRIIDQWVELKLHFNTTALDEKCHKASILSELYSEGNYLYLLFLKPILEVMQRINKNFQSNTSNPTKLLGDLTYGINFLKFDFEEEIKRDLYFGYEFESNLRKIKTINEITDFNIRQHCSDFVVELINQLKQRYENCCYIIFEMQV